MRGRMGEAPRTRHARFSNYRAAECRTRLRSQRTRGRRPPPPSSALHPLCGYRIGGDAGAFWAMLRAGGCCGAWRRLHKPARARGCPPSLESLDLGNAVLRRGDITERGRVVHDILGVLCGGIGVFVLRRGNPCVVAALRGGP